jgi:hypothetical protein
MVPTGYCSGSAAISLSALERLWNGDEDVASPFRARTVPKIESRGGK